MVENNDSSSIIISASRSILCLTHSIIHPVAENAPNINTNGQVLALGVVLRDYSIFTVKSWTVKKRKASRKWKMQKKRSYKEKLGYAKVNNLTVGWKRNKVWSGLWLNISIRVPKATESSYKSSYNPIYLFSPLSSQVGMTDEHIYSIIIKLSGS